MYCIFKNYGFKNVRIHGGIEKKKIYMSQLSYNGKISQLVMMYM